MKTSEIREDDSKGRHTTTHRQLIEVKEGVFIIDTPGIIYITASDVGVKLYESYGFKHNGNFMQYNF